VVSRASITTVLNLNIQGNSLSRHVTKLLGAIGFTLNEVYATNAVNCFFTMPPAHLGQGSVLQHAFSAWQELLLGEIAEYPKVPVITLGEPVLRLISGEMHWTRLRDHWGYPGWRAEPLSYLSRRRNLLQRDVFPFPHQSSFRKAFYARQLPAYSDFTRGALLERSAKSAEELGSHGATAKHPKWA
jgi:hypothetical protein